MTENEWLDMFASNLEQDMRQKRCSQKDLAKYSGLSEAAISMYLNRRRMPTMKAVINIAYALDLSLNDLLDYGEMIDPNY